MSNIFIRTNIAPYRIDIYNALHERLGMKMCFYNRCGKAQKFDIDKLEAQCNFSPVYLRGITLKSDNRKWCFGLWRMLRREKPVVVIVPEFQISALQVLMFRWLWRRKFKVVAMIDDSYDMIANNNDFTHLHARLREIMPQHYDDVIVVTPEVERWYQERFQKGIWLPIIMDDVKAANLYERILPISSQLAKHYNLVGKRVLLSVSRLVDLKNLHCVIDAFAKTRTDAVLVIVGVGPEREKLEQHAKQTGKQIIFTGRFDGDELYAWYNLASVFILASYQEPFGAVTNEALLAGCRVVVSKKAGSSCLVSDANGELIDPMNVEEIVSAIDRQMQFSIVPDLSRTRKSLMTVSFEERIENLVEKLNTRV